MDSHDCKSRDHSNEPFQLIALSMAGSILAVVDAYSSWTVEDALRHLGVIVPPLNPCIQYQLVHQGEVLDGMQALPLAANGILETTMMQSTSPDRIVGNYRFAWLPVRNWQTDDTRRIQLEEHHFCVTSRGAILKPSLRFELERGLWPHDESPGHTKTWYIDYFESREPVLVQLKFQTNGYVKGSIDCTDTYYTSAASYFRGFWELASISTIRIDYWWDWDEHSTYRELNLEILPDGHLSLLSAPTANPESWIGWLGSVFKRCIHFADFDYRYGFDWEGESDREGEDDRDGESDTGVAHCLRNSFTCEVSTDDGDHFCDCCDIYDHFCFSSICNRDQYTDLAFCSYGRESRRETRRRIARESPSTSRRLSKARSSFGDARRKETLRKRRHVQRLRTLRLRWDRLDKLCRAI